jgi:Methyltransferase domain
VKKARQLLRRSLKRPREGQWGRRWSASFGLFRAADRLGFHFLPKHYYTPVPDLSWLLANRPLWESPADMSHTPWDIDAQLAWVRQCCAGHYSEVSGLSLYRRLVASGAGPGYGPIESQVLHCFVRRHRPRRVVEVGSGISTLIILHADTLNRSEGDPAASVVCVEPYPQAVLTDTLGIKLIEKPVQAVEQAVFDQLGAGDLLFVDSSHSVKTGADPIRIYLQIIPALAPGVIVHIHDVFLPYLYPRDSLVTYFGWQETALLLALLTDNPRLTVLGSLSALHYGRPAALREAIPDYSPQLDDAGLAAPGASGHFPSSTYLVTG